MHRRQVIGLMGLTLSTGVLAACAGQSSTVSPQQRLVDQSETSVRTMLESPDFTILPLYLQRARAVVIFPNLVRGGFFFGGEGGEGVLVARMADGSWGYPAFYDMISGSFGLQIGGQLSSMIIAVMTQDGLNSILDSQFTFGADANVAIVTVGAGVDARTGLNQNADMYAFSRNRGLFVGGALEGSLLRPAEAWNRAYYGPSASTFQVVQGDFTNPGADGLRIVLPPQQVATR
ncbi:MAG: lipid-binding SYLF domain-containing protein [Pseudomonadota bacterium]